MIGMFRIGSNVSPHLHNSRDLVERVVALTNEYTVNYVKNLEAPKRINLKEYDRDLLALIHKLLDKRIKRPLRNYVTVRIKREDDDAEDSILEIVWNEKYSNFIIPKQPLKGSVTVH